MARKKVVRSNNRRKKVDGKRRNSASTGMLRDVAEDILIRSGLGHARNWWNENPYGPPTHNIASHTYGDLNAVNNITANVVHNYQLSKIKSLEMSRFKQADQILKTSGFKNIDNFIKILNSKSDNDLLDFNTIAQNIFNNLSIIGNKVSHLDKNNKYKNEENATRVLEEVQNYYDQINDTLLKISEDLKSSGSSTITLIQALNDQMENIKSALDGSTSSVGVLTDLAAQFKSGSSLLKTKGLALEEIGTQKIEKEISKIRDKFNNNLQVLHSGQQLVNKTSDKSDIRIMLFDNINNYSHEELITMKDISTPIRQTISDINIQAKSGRTQLAWNNASKYTNVSDTDLVSVLNGNTAFHYLDLLKTLSQENTNKGIWQEIKKTSKYYDLIAAYGLTDKLGDIINLTENFNTILLTSEGFETYYTWFSRRLKSADHIVKLQDSINLKTFGSGSHKVSTGRIALGNKK